MSSRRCCCLWNLRDGSIAIGITLLVLHGLNFVVNIGLLARQYSQPRLESDDGPAVPPARIPLIANIVVFVVHAIFNSLLVHGARRDRRNMVLAWLVYQGIGCVAGTCGLLVSLVLSAISAEPVIIVTVFVGLGVAALLWYWFFVVLLHYRELRQTGGAVVAKPSGTGSPE